MREGAKHKLASFYSDVAAQFPLNNPNEKVAFIVVGHVLPDKPIFIKSLEQYGRIAAVIPKTSERDSNVYKRMERMFSLHNEVTKGYLRDEDKAVSFIKNVTKANEKVIIIDIGGYFAPSLKRISHDPELKDRLVGVVEGTANGQRKYEKVVGLSNHPVYSKAYSPLKSPEDHNVGKSIVAASDTIIRNAENMTLEDFPKVGVIGFGKIGKGITHHLKNRDITVYDDSPEIMAMASAMGYKVAPKEEVLKNSDFLFLATGNGSLKGKDFKQLKDGVFLSSCTSCDDEMDISWLQKNSKETTHCDTINTFKTSEGKEVNMLLRGKAVNFHDKGVIGPPIYLAGAEFIADSAKLLNGKGDVSKGLQVLEKDEREKIASQWLKHYAGYNLETKIMDTVVSKANSRSNGGIV